MNVSEIMTKEVVTVGPDETVRDVVEKFASERISGAPVVDSDGRMVGIISEKDIINAIQTKCKRLEMVYPSLSMVSVSFIECFDDKEIADAFTEIANTPISQLMKKEVAIIDFDKSIGQAIELMNKRSVNRIPILKGDKLVGIVTRKDIIRGLALNSK